MHSSRHTQAAAGAAQPAHHLEVGRPDHLARGGGVHTDDAGAAQIQHVARVRKLVLRSDGDDLVAFRPHVRGQLHALPAHGRTGSRGGVGWGGVGD